MTILFQEKQKPIIDNNILIVIAILGNVFLLSISLLTIVILLPFDILLFLLLRFMCLKISITENAISYKFFPYHTSWRELKFDSFFEIEIITYNAIGDFRGTGRRHQIYKNEKAYVTDYNGNALRLKNIIGYTFIFGIRNHDELKRILPKLKTTANIAYT
jgi:hypothetical protein